MGCRQAPQNTMRASQVPPLRPLRPAPLPPPPLLPVRPLMNRGCRCPMMMWRKKERPLPLVLRSLSRMVLRWWKPAPSSQGVGGTCEPCFASELDRSSRSSAACRRRVALRRCSGEGDFSRPIPSRESRWVPSKGINASSSESRVLIVTHVAKSGFHLSSVSSQRPAEKLICSSRLCDVVF